MTLRSRCHDALARADGRDAIRYRGEWLGWDRVRSAAGDLEAWLDAAGLGPGARVGLAPRNRPAALAALIALFARGMTVVMIHSYQSTAGIAADIARYDLDGFIADEADFTDEVVAALDGLECSGLGLRNGEPGIRHVHPARPATRAGPPHILLLTSGTTGAPKHHPFSYEQIDRMIGDNIAVRGQSASIPALLYFPAGNIAGLRAGLAALLNFQSAILLDRFTIGDWRDYIVCYRPASASLPTAAISMALDAEIPRADLESLEFVMTGAAPLAVSVQAAFEQRYGIPILLAYGATEFGGPVTQFALADRERFGTEKLGSVGRAYGGNQIRIRDAESGALLGPGAVGRLEVKAERMGPDWIRTNDIGCMDTDGFVFIRGRADGAINRGGFKLSPEAIEAALMRYPGVKAVSVVAIPDPRLGEVPAAALVLEQDVAVPGMAELEAHVRQHVYATHVPAAWLFLPELPCNATLKVDRGAVQRLFG